MITKISAEPSRRTLDLNPAAMVRNLWQRRDLIAQLTRREVEGRYKGSHLGLLWTFIHPLVMLLIYTFVFGVVFKIRWPEARTGSLSEFAVTVFCGLVVFNLFSECVGRAAGLVTANPNYVKKVVFPLEVLPLPIMGAALFHGLISLAILVAANLVVSGQVHWTLCLVPLAVIPLLFLVAGLLWILSALGVFFRDVLPVVSLALSALFYATPIFYSLDAVPPLFRALIRLNPLSSIVDNVRALTLWGRVPSWEAWPISTAACVLFALIGYAFFMKTKRGFADVI